ncbi:MAG: hypothetical protein PHS49_07720 [Candidatus Gracilibacteria bacterium]|nr:hypothetical protein [Candidatus Gracilibacteria bacterium]
MKKIYYTILGYIFTTKYSFADGGILGDTLTEKELRTGDIHTDDIPNILRGAIDFMLGIAGTIAIIFIIIGAYQLLLGSFESDKTKGKNTIIMAIGGFMIASLAWFIINFIIDNLS